METQSNSSIGYASYQQQHPNTDGRPNEVVSIALFFSIIFLILVSFVFYFWFTEWHKIKPQQRREEELERQKEIDQLVANIKQQVKTTFRIPVVALALALWNSAFASRRHAATTITTPTHTSSQSTHGFRYPPVHFQPPLQPHASREHAKVLAHRAHHLFSLLFIVCVLVALAILIGTVGSPVSSHTSTVLQASLFVFVLCINLYLITRQRFYYKERKELFGSHDAHMNAVYKTRFSDWDTKLWSNWVQIAILIIEFFQLLTFPLRDLITVNSFDNDLSGTQAEFTRLVSIIMNAGGLMPDMRTPTWYTYSLWTAFATTMASLVAAVIVHCVNLWRPNKIPNRWVRWCIPVATLLYIPILTTFVSSAACQSLNVSTNDYAPTLRCNAAQISRPLYLWMSLLGYIVAYFLITLFLTSYERRPKHNEIAFKSISVAFIKNMGLLLAIVFLLVESTTNKNRMRAILSITILLTMICYNIKTRPCYVDKINFFRSASFSCILWTSVLVAILSDTNAAQSLGPLAVLCIIVGGWALIVALFVLVYFFYYKKSLGAAEDGWLDSGITLSDEETDAFRSPIHEHFGEKHVPGEPVKVGTMNSHAGSKQGSLSWATRWYSSAR